MTIPRTSGTLLHPTSLPSRFGVGDLGPEAYAFVDFLKASGQTLWQMLPLGPTGDGLSPYSSSSAFAGNVDLISPELLVRDGWLDVSDLEVPPGLVEDPQAARKFKRAILKEARLRNDAGRFETFCHENAHWLDDYAEFAVLKRAYLEAPWVDWPEDLRGRDDQSLEQARNENAAAIEAEKFYQFLFFAQWTRLREYCREQGIKLIGDVPFFVAHDSSDVWTKPGIFKLNENGDPTVVAGVPPDYFSETGQYWGNPLFRWENEFEVTKWWISRLEMFVRRFDFVRIDHFRGFVACWEIPAKDKTAQNGRWVETPGKKLFAAMKNHFSFLRASTGSNSEEPFAPAEFEGALGVSRERKLGDLLPIIAEDLGYTTPEVEDLRDECGFPGMRVLQFGFNSDRDNIHLPHNYPANSVAYTGTHDNNTSVGWFEELSLDPARAQEREFCLEYLGSDGKEINWNLINAALESAAKMAIIPVQDVLGLGGEARMNTPNTSEGNWQWRFSRSGLTIELADRLKRLTVEAGRN